MKPKAEVGSATSTGNGIADFLVLHVGVLPIIGQLFSHKATLPTKRKFRLNLPTFLLISLLLALVTVAVSVLQAEVSPCMVLLSKMLPP